MSQPDSDLNTLLAAVPFASCPITNVIAAGQPAQATFAGFAAAGYKTVIDLRAPQEPRGFDEPSAVRSAGLEYINIPVTGASLTDDTFGRFRALMRDPAKRPALVHCGSATRVGALLLPYFILDERMERDDAMDLAARAGLRSPDLADVALAYVDSQT